jgi:CxxC motif-containing protein (DUF1111 family)
MRGALALLSASLVLAGCEVPAIGTSVQEDAHPPHAWRELTPDQQKTFDLGYAVFNTEWSPAQPQGARTDGLGPIFNAQSCDACHNSRRRGRGPRAAGDAPADLVMQLGRRLADGTIARGTEEYGHVLNTAAIKGFTPEASISIAYDETTETLSDGTQVTLRAPRYLVSHLSGPALPANVVLMPRLPPPIFGTGLLERVLQKSIVAIAESQRHARSGVAGEVSWVEDHGTKVIGRFGWQATQPTVSTQTSVALAREMGLTTPLDAHIDCGANDDQCKHALSGGDPEVEGGLFDAVVFFESMHAVPVATVSTEDSPGRRVFEQSGCASCHLPALSVSLADQRPAKIHAYTDLLLHDVGTGLADRDLSGNAVPSRWRTAPLWGMNAAVASRQPLRLLHDGRAHSIDEAVLWHGGEAGNAVRRFRELPASQHSVLIEWIEQQ